MWTAPEPEHRKCAICGINDVPIFPVVIWCDQCINEYNEGNESLGEFIKRKRAETGYKP